MLPVPPNTRQERLKNASVQNVQLHAELKARSEAGYDAEQMKVEADISAEVMAATRKEMAEWLGRNRLHLHAEVITAVAGL